MSTETAPVAEGQDANASPEGAGQAGEFQEQSVWYDSAPDEVKGYIQNKGWDDPIKAVTSYQELEKFRGASEDELIRMPKEGETFDAIYDKLGRPEAANKYEWEAPDGISTDDGRFDMYKEVAYKAGISQEQFKALADADAEYWQGKMQEQQEAIVQKQTAELEALKKEWGSAYDERNELGRRFVAQNLPADIDKKATLEAMEQAIGTAAMLKLFANAGSKAVNVEDKLPTGEGEKPFGYSPEQAKADKAALLSELKASPERLTAYNSGNGADYDKMMRLNKIIAG